MIFDRVYTKSGVLDHISVDGDEFVKSARSALCWNCGRGTHWFSVSFMAPLCSSECATEKWNEYWKAVNNEKTQDSSASDS